MSSLSAAQQQFVDQVAQGTGLDPSVVAAWVAQESGWGTTEGGSNYLNIGPGYSYPSVSQAAAATVDLITSSPDYAGIAGSAGQSPAEQIAQITASPWDAGHYSATDASGQPYNTLLATYNSQGNVQAVDTGFFSSVLNFLGQNSPVAGGVAAMGLAQGGGASVLSGIGTGWVKDLVTGLFNVMFVVAGLGLIVLGLARVFPGITKTVETAVPVAA